MPKTGSIKKFIIPITPFPLRKPMESASFDVKHWRRLFTIYKLAEMGAKDRVIKISTEYLAERMGTSQQTASRHLIEVERLGWIKKMASPKGCMIELTDKGKSELEHLHKNMKLFLEAKLPPSITIEGYVFSGYGEGAYYISREGYKKQFVEQLGFNPYPGTLNLKLTSEYDLKIAKELEFYPSIIIKGFQNKNRTYGPVRCLQVLINNRIKGAIVLALRSHYDTSVLEVISPVFLRGKLKLKDGHKVRLEIISNSQEKEGTDKVNE